MLLSHRFLPAFLLLLSPALAAELNVVATHSDLAAIATAVGGNSVRVTGIIEPTQDPHFVDARPHLMLVLNKADLLILVGLQLEVGWLPNLLTGARNPRILPGSPGYLDSSTLVQRLQVPQGQVDRSLGDLHPGGNPHFTKSPHAAIRIAHGLARRFTQLDPKGASSYRRNLANFENRLREAIGKWETMMRPYRGAKVVTYHKSWIYFTSWLNLHNVAYVEPKPGISPDPAHVAQLLKTMRQQNIPIILQEEYYPDATARLLANKSKAHLILCHGGVHLKQGDSYITYIDRLVRAIVAVLERQRGPQ